MSELTPHADLADDEQSLLALSASASLSAAVNTDPDLAAEVARLAAKHNVPVPSTEAAIRALQQRERDAQQAETLKRNPKLAAWLALAENAAVAHDDVGVLEEVGQHILELPKGVPAGGVKTVGAAVVGAGANLQGTLRDQLVIMDRIDRGEAVPEFEDLTGYQHLTPEWRQQVRSEIERSASTPVAETPIVKAGHAIQKFGDEILPAAPGYENSVTRQLGEGLGSTAVGIAVSAIPIVGLAAAGGMFSLAGSGEAVDRAIKAGATEQQIIDAARLGMFPGLTDSIPVETLLGRLPIPGGKLIQVPANLLGKALKSIGRIGWQAFIEGVQESGQQFLQNLIAQDVYKPDQDLAEGILPAGGIGAGVGVISEVARQALANFAGRYRTHVVRKAVERQAQEYRQVLEGVRGVALKSKTRERSPEHFRSAVQSMAEGGDKVIYVPAKVAQEHYESTEEDPRAAVTAIGLDYDQLDQAALAGRDVEVPIDVYLSLDDAAHAVLADHARPEPEGLSIADIANNEVERRIEEKRVRMEAKLREIDETAESAFDVAEQARRTMIEAGLPEHQANSVAILMAAMHNATATRSGLSTEELLDQIGGLPGFRVEAPNIVSRLDDQQLDALLDEARQVEPGGDISEGSPSDAQSLAAFLDNAGIDFRNESNLSVRSLLRKAQYATAISAIMASSKQGNGIEGLDANVLGSAAALIIDDPAYSNPDADQIRLALRPKEADALRDAGVAVSDDGSITRADAERLLAERNRRNAWRLGAEADGARKPVTDIGAAQRTNAPDVRGDIVNAEGAGNHTLYQDDARSVPRLTPEQINGVDPETGDHRGCISSSLPTTKNPIIDPLVDKLVAGVTAMRSAWANWTHHVGLVLDYVNMPESARTLEPDDIAKAFIDQAVGNLLFLHDQVPQEVRELTRRWYDGARDLVTRWAEKYGIPDTGIAGAIAALSPRMDWDQNVSLAERLLDIWTKHQNTEWTEAMSRAAESVVERAPKLASILRTIQGKQLGEIVTLGLREDAVDQHIALWVRVYDQAHHQRGHRAVTLTGEFVGVPSGNVRWHMSNEAIAKAISVIRNPSVENVSRKMGRAHKVRSFYNNILAPNAPHGDVTVDRHAVGAALMRPLSYDSVEVAHNFNAGLAKDKQPKGWKRARRDGNSGATGTYGLHAEAYRQAAKILGIRPRELQSIIWVAWREKFGGQRKNISAANEIWQGYRDGKTSIEEVRKDVYGLGRGVGAVVSRASADRDDAVLSDTSYAGELSGDGLSGRPAGPVGSRAGSGAAGAAADPEHRELKQGAGKAKPRGSIVFPKGGITKGRTLINLYAGRDLSTILHEFSHYMLEVLRATAERDGAPADLREMWAQAQKALGLENLQPGEQIPTEAHEQWARWGEAYFGTGKAPSVELQPAFDRFRAWMLQVWAYVKRMYGKEVETKVPAEVREVFDRMLATDQQIAEAQRTNHSERVFDDAAAAGMTPGQWAAYIAQDEKARSEAVNRAQAAVVAEWERRKSAMYRDARRAARAEARAALAKGRVHVVREVLTNGRMPQDADNDNAPAVGLEDIRLDRQAMIDMGYEKRLNRRLANGDAFPRGKRAIYTDEGGLHPDAVAAMFGYETGREMLDDLLASPGFEDAIEVEAERILRERFGDLLTDGGIQLVTLEGMHAKERAKLLEMELNALYTKAPVSSIAMQKPPPRQMIREAARRMLVRMPVVQARRADLFLAAERRAARETQRALAKGDFVEGREAKQRQLLNFYLWGGSQRLSEETADAKALIKRINRRENKVSKGADVDFVMAARVVLSRFGLAAAPQRFHLDAWLARLEADDPQSYEEIGRAIALATGPAQDWRKLTVAEYRHLIQAVQALLAAVERRRVVELGGKRVDVEKARHMLLGGISGDAKAVERTREFAAGLGAFLLSTDAATRRVESWARLVDGRDAGPVMRLIVQPVQAALEAYRAERTRRVGRVSEIVGPLVERLQATGAITAPELGGFRFAHMGEVLMALLNTGTESNARRLFEGYGWSEAGWQAFLGRLIADGRLGRADIDAVQAIWDLFADLRAPAGRAHRAIYGHDADRVRARPLAMPFGSYRGGWVPVVVDKSRGAVDPGGRATMFLPTYQSSGLFPTAAESSIARPGRGRAPLELSLRALPGHVDKVLRFTSLLPAVRAVARILSDPSFRQAASKTDPQLVSGLLIPWLQRTALQTVDTPGSGVQLRWFEPALRFARRTASAGPMVRSAVDALQPTARFSSGPTRIRPGSLARSLFLYYARPGAATRFVVAHSPLMRRHIGADAKAAIGGLRDLLVEPSQVGSADALAQRWGIVLHFVARGMVAPPLWLAAFDEASQRGLRLSEAARHADTVVRETRSMRAPNHGPAIDAGGSVGRAMAMLRTYFHAPDGRDGGTAAIAASVIALPAVLARAIELDIAARGTDAEDGETSDALRFVIDAQVGYVLAMLPFLKAGSDGAVSSVASSLLPDAIGAATGTVEQPVAGNDDAVIVKDTLTAVMMLLGLGGSDAIAQAAGYAVRGGAGRATGRPQPKFRRDFLASML